MNPEAPAIATFIGFFYGEDALVGPASVLLRMFIVPLPFGRRRSSRARGRRARSGTGTDGSLGCSSPLAGACRARDRRWGADAEVRRGSSAASHVTVSAPCAGVRRSGPSLAKEGSPGPDPVCPPSRDGPRSWPHRDSPSVGPFVGQHNLGPFGLPVGDRAPVPLWTDLNVVRIESLGVHAARCHRRDDRLLGTEQERGQQPAQAKRCEHVGGQCSLRQRSRAVVCEPIVREERTGIVDECMDFVVHRCHPVDEGRHSSSIDHIDLGRMDGPLPPADSACLPATRIVLRSDRRAKPQLPTPRAAPLPLARCRRTLRSRSSPCRRVDPDRSSRSTCRRTT